MSKIVNGKEVTCAVVICDKNGNILGCHGTGKPQDSGYDFPKGLADEGEEDIYAAVRELHEEAGITIPPAFLVDCGVHPHNKQKNIHIFLYKVSDLSNFNIDSLRCITYFELNGKHYPEVDGYKIISKEERNMFNKVLWNKFTIIDEKI